MTPMSCLCVCQSVCVRPSASLPHTENKKYQRAALFLFSCKFCVLKLFFLRLVASAKRGQTPPQRPRPSRHVRRGAGGTCEARYSDRPEASKSASRLGQPRAASHAPDGPTGLSFPDQKKKDGPPITRTPPLIGAYRGWHFRRVCAKLQVGEDKVRPACPVTPQPDVHGLVVVWA